MITYLSKTVNAIVKCVQGEHNSCDSSSLMCRSGRRWSCGFVVSPGTEDVDLLKSGILYRLSPDSIGMSHLGHSTQKSESFNRSLHRSLPKNVLYKRNVFGRTHATVHRLNNRFDVSFRQQLEAVGCHLDKCKKVLMYLKSVKAKIINDQKRQRSLKYKARRNYLRAKRFEEYESRNVDVAKGITYAKGLMDPISMSNAAKEIKKDHIYAQDIKKVQSTITNDHSY